MKKKSVSVKKLVSLAASGKLNAAFKMLKKSTRGKTDAEIWIQLSGIYGGRGSLRLTKVCCEKALEIDPDYALAYSHLGNVYIAAGDLSKAMNCSQHAVNLHPDDPSILYNFAIICRNSGNYTLALQCILKAIEYRPDHPESHYIAGSCYQVSGNLEKLVEHYTKAIQLKPDFIDCLVNLGYHYTNIGDIVLAGEYFDRALMLDNKNSSALSGKADALLRNGEKAASYAIIRKLIDSDDITANALYTYSLLGKDYGDEVELVKLTEQALSQPGLLNTDKTVLGFTLGRAYDRVGEYDKAFNNYKIGNDASNIAFDTIGYSVYILNIRDYYSREYAKNIITANHVHDEPVFIIGMPRSGTSLIEQILSRHSKVHAAGELNYIPDMVKRAMDMTGAGGMFPSGLGQLTADQLNDLALEHIERLRALVDKQVKRITDKMPSNYTYLGLIAQVFPKAKIIHCQRDPRDTCLSIYFQNFQNFQKYAGDIKKIGLVYLEYKKLMEHWNDVLDIPILNIQYESVVADAEAKSREIIEFCGLDWEDACMDFHRSKRRVITASFDQVNKPIYSKSVARWRNYEKHLHELQKILQPVLFD